MKLSKSMTSSAFNIRHNLFKSKKMILLSIHELTNKIYNERHIRSGDNQVWKNTSKKRNRVGSENNFSSPDRCWSTIKKKNTNKLGINHESMLQEIKSIFWLTEKQTLLISLNFNTEKVIKITQIFYREFLGESSNKGVNQRRIIARNNHVINININIKK
jgi:hypothetical protein